MCVSQLRKETQSYPQFANFDDSSAVANDYSMSSISGVETPNATATPGQPKLKLTFNAGGAMAGMNEDQ
jgi:ATP-dependent helicase STH1/SNF2